MAAPVAWAFLLYPRSFRQFVGGEGTGGISRWTLVDLVIFHHLVDATALASRRVSGDTLAETSMNTLLRWASAGLVSCALGHSVFSPAQAERESASGCADGHVALSREVAEIGRNAHVCGDGWLRGWLFDLQARLFARPGGD